MFYDGDKYNLEEAANAYQSCVFCFPYEMMRYGYRRNEVYGYRFIGI